MESAPSGAPGERRTRIVIIDERPLPRAAARQALSGDPLLEVIGEAGRSVDAEALVVQTRPDVLVCGLHGAGFDELELLRRLRGRGLNAKVLLLAADVDTAHVLEAVEAGVDGYLLGDISPADLARAVRDMARGGKPLHPRVARVVVDEAVSSSRRGARTALQERGLSHREVDVLAMLASGLHDREIAARLVISKATVKTHLRSIFRKLKVHTRVQAAMIAIRHRLVRADETPG
jgi:DNA-binding NarL/FixJ family response regulator